MPQYATIEGTAVELKIRSIPEREIVIGNQNNFKRLNITEEFKRVRLEKKGYEAATKLKTIGNTACSVYVSKNMPQKVQNFFKNFEYNVCISSS